MTLFDLTLDYKQTMTLYKKKIQTKILLSNIILKFLNKNIFYIMTIIFRSAPIYNYYSADVSRNAKRQEQLETLELMVLNQNFSYKYLIELDFRSLKS